MSAAARLWQFDAQLPAAALAQIAEGVRIAEQQLSQGSDAQPIACALFDGEALLAGASGRTEGQRLFIEQLWVRADLRGQGLAGDCLRQLEAQALRAAVWMPWPRPCRMRPRTCSNTWAMPASPICTTTCPA